MKGKMSCKFATMAFAKLRLKWKVDWKTYIGRYNSSYDGVDIPDLYMLKPLESRAPQQKVVQETMSGGAQMMEADVAGPMSLIMDALQYYSMHIIDEQGMNSRNTIFKVNHDVYTELRQS